jgi:hypothetical protein
MPIVLTIFTSIVNRVFVLQREKKHGQGLKQKPSVTIQLDLRLTGVDSILTFKGIRVLVVNSLHFIKKLFWFRFVRVRHYPVYPG